MKKTIILLVALFATTFSFAQTKDFTGTWILKQRISISGPNYVNGMSNVIELGFKGDSLTIKRTGSQNGQDVITSETLSPDGKVHNRINPSKRKKTVTVTLSADKRSFTENAALSMAEDINVGDYTYADVFTLSADGKTLTVEKHFASAKNQADQWVMKGEYEKQ